mmetsp:Transcript_57096/g.119396  ORF Transcript_57096/g.119396 Transcript_57096/m.119396 type:complete len:171 (-) Transcript_57096:64-576(-)
MGNETSQLTEEDKGKHGSLAKEILKLKAAKSSGWLSEEEFDTELKRVLREWNGDTREPAYDYFEVVRDGLSDSSQMAEWEAQYGPGSFSHSSGRDDEAGAELLSFTSSGGMVELDLTGGAPAKAKPHTEDSMSPSGAHEPPPSPAHLVKLAPPSDDIIGADSIEDLAGGE